MPAQRADFDTPWKNIFDSHFQDFMEICHPTVAREIDWSKGYELLDKELSAITKDAESGNSRVDKLIKVSRRDSQEALVYFHVEIQAQKQTKAVFQKRMFVYHYRLFDRYQMPIVSLALLIDDQPKWRPSAYEYALWGCKLQFNFVTVKLLDYKDKEEELFASTNPFALVLLAHLAYLKTKKDAQERLFSKFFLTRRLYDKGWDKADIIKLYRFIDWILELPEPLEVEYNKQVNDFEQEKKMEYISSYERMCMKEGRISALQHQLQRKFGAIPANYQKCIAQGNDEELFTWLENVIFAGNIKEVFEEQPSTIKSCEQG